MKKMKGRLFAVLLAASVVTGGIATSALAAETDTIAATEALTTESSIEETQIVGETENLSTDASASSEAGAEYDFPPESAAMETEVPESQPVDGACVDPSGDVALKEHTFIKFDKRLDYQVYDGQPHGLYAAVYNMNNEKIADAAMYYTGVEADGTVYRSYQPPVNVGAYQVTAFYCGDDAHYMAPVDVYASLVILPAPAAVVRINDITSSCFEVGPFNYSYETEGILAQDVDNILAAIYCEESDPETTHTINGTLNMAVAKNYKSVTIVPGTHYIICEKYVNLTVITDGRKGRFVDYANPTYELLPVEEGAVYVLPDVEAYPGYEFAGWIVRGAHRSVFGPEFKNLNYVDLAWFDETGHVGGLLAEAVYKKSVAPVPPETETEEPTTETEEPTTETEEPTTETEEPTTETEEPTTETEEPTTETEEPTTETKEPTTETEEPTTETKEPTTETEEPTTEDTKETDTKNPETKETESKKPEETKENKKEDSVKTGDRAPIAICFMMLVMSLASMVVVIFARKRR